MLDILNIWNRQFAELLVNVGVVWFGVVWVLLIIFTIRDVTMRTNSLFLQVISVAFSFFHFPGFIIYLLIRPIRS